MIIVTNRPEHHYGGTIHEYRDEIELLDVLDADSRMYIQVDNTHDNGWTTINRDQAQQIVNHLTQVFSLEKKA